MDPKCVLALVFANAFEIACVIRKLKKQLAMYMDVCMQNQVDINEALLKCEALLLC